MIITKDCEIVSEHRHNEQITDPLYGASIFNIWVHHRADDANKPPPIRVYCSLRREKPDKFAICLTI